MPLELTLNDELAARLETHMEDDETHEEFIEELLSIYESGGRFLQEGYSE